MMTRLTSQILRFMPIRTSRRYIHTQRGTLESLHQPNVLKKLLVDVSVISRNDARTGIQRVVRSILQALLENPPTGYQVFPIAATRRQGYYYTKYVPSDVKNSTTHLPNGKVHVAPGDIFLGLDLAANILPHQHTELMRWKRQGGMLYFLVYDLLPVLHPNWFNPKTTHNIRRWLKTISVFADGCICISNVVKNDLLKWMDKHYGIASGSISMVTIQLGSDIDASSPTKGLSEDDHQLLKTLADKPSILMVGTLEPRKGHRQVLGAFELLWHDGADLNFVIVGKPGWKTGELQDALNLHPEKNIRLYWLHDASDEMVQKLYETCSGVIVASEAEGFGLPLFEASFYGKPVLARDIPVFRETADTGVTFFTEKSSKSFANVLIEWINRIKYENSLQYHDLSHQNAWCNTSNQLIDFLQNPTT